MKMSRLIILIVVIVLVIIGYINLKQNNKVINTELFKLWEKELLIHDTLLNENYLSCNHHKKFIIISIVDGDCSCSVETIEKWQEFISGNELITKKTKVIIFVNSARAFFVHCNLFKKIAPDIRFIFDPDNLFITTNDLNQLTTDFMTFLIDSTKVIKLVGNPVSNSEVKELYLSFLAEN
jgi:hypothetical protein